VARYGRLVWHKAWIIRACRWRREGWYVENGPVRLVIAMGFLKLYIPRAGGGAPELSSRPGLSPRDRIHLILFLAVIIIVCIQGLLILP
jgi:hypothetical protein